MVKHVFAQRALQRMFKEKEDWEDNDEEDFSEFENQIYVNSEYDSDF